MIAIGSFFHIYKVSRNFNPRTVHVGHVDEGLETWGVIHVEK